MAQGQRRTKATAGAKEDTTFRIPTHREVKRALLTMAQGAFQLVDTADGPILMANYNQVDARFFYPDRRAYSLDGAMASLSRRGPSLLQTFSAMCGFWLAQRKGQPYDTKIEAKVTDLLRYMGRRGTSGGGFKREDIEQRARDIGYLMHMSFVVVVAGDREETVTITRLAQVEEIKMLKTQDKSQPPVSVTFRYHLGKEIHDYLCGPHPQFTEVSKRLLLYHPEKERYHILLGYVLSYDRRVNKAHPGRRRISLTDLLESAAIPIPERNHQRFYDQIRRAIEALNADGVIRGVQICAPEGVNGRALISHAMIEYTIPKGDLPPPQ